MELAIKFATFCNVCFKKDGLRKLKENEQLFKILMLFIENKVVIKGQDIYLCLNCCEKLESYNQFKEMCLRNFIDFRVEYSELRKKLEKMNDPNAEKKLKYFIDTKVCGTSDSRKGDGSENIENNVAEKQDERNGGYNFHTVVCKTEKMDDEEYDEYKLHTEVDMANNEDNFELPVPIEHIKVESFIEQDIDSNESNEKNGVKQDERDPIADSALNKIPEIKCGVCKKEFTKIDDLKTHMRVHNSEKHFTCTVCNKSFTQSTTFKTHQAIHTEGTRYSCSFCNKTYSKAKKLRIHERIHTGEAHICSVCNKVFSVWYQLKNHMLIHTGEMPHTCLICNKSFRRMENLKKHERVHTGEKPYACTTCDKTFRDLGHLKSHELIHTGEKPHTCEVCKKAFRHKKSLKDHERVHSGDMPYACEICHKAYRRSSSLKLHKQKPCVQYIKEENIIEQCETNSK